MKLQNGLKRNRSRTSSRRGSNRSNAPYNSNGAKLDNKIKGNPSQVQGRYENLARDASSAGDRIAAENYLQHAEHYIRINRENKLDNNVKHAPKSDIHIKKSFENKTINSKDE